MRLLLAASCILLAPVLAAAQAAGFSCASGDARDFRAISVEASVAARGSRSSPLGANILYFIDDDKAWQDGLSGRLRPLALSAMRFPGGEVSDRYDWENVRAVNAAEDGNGGAAAPDSAKYTDYLEFLAQARKTGVANLYFVVNLEGAFLGGGDRQDNIRRYAEKAARWVSAVRRNGYKVKYWEVGNESNHDSTTVSLTAAEYADALVVFARAMKAADPDIVIAANGPSNGRASGFADKLTPAQLEFFRGKGRKLCGRKPDKQCMHKLREAVPGTAKPEPWWQVVAARAGAQFDMAVVHSYSSVWLDRKGKGGPEIEGARLQRLHEMLERRTGRKIAISVTEWNVPPKRRETVTPGAAALSNVVKLGGYMAIGVQDALIWPIRYPGEESRDRVLLSMNGLDTTPMYRTLQALAPALDGGFAGQETFGEVVYALRTVAAAGERVVLVNQGDRAQGVSLGARDGRAHSVAVRQLAGAQMEGAEICRSKAVAGDVRISLPPRSLTVVVLAH